METTKDRELTWSERYFFANGETWESVLDRKYPNRTEMDWFIPSCGIGEDWDERGIPKYESEIAGFKLKNYKIWR